MDRLGCTYWQHFGDLMLCLPMAAGNEPAITIPKRAVIGTGPLMEDIDNAPAAVHPPEEA